MSNKTANKGADKPSSSRVYSVCFYLLLLVAVVLGYGSHSGKFNVLKILSSDREYSTFEVQFISCGFCLSPLIPMLLNNREVRPEVLVANASYTFEETGNIGEDDYTVESIYSILYSMYKHTPELVSPFGVKYQFTFNTWGIAPSPYDERTDPERHGKAAYRALIVQPAAVQYMAERNVGVHWGESSASVSFAAGKAGQILPPQLAASGDKVQVVEIGCGTAAGANLITREVLKGGVEYLGLDMQQAAINTCRERHATEDNPALTCQQVPGGVGGGLGDTQKVPKPDNSVDFVVISETHIADERIGDMEKAIFAEIHRILKPGGLFLWGNALPTRVWNEAKDYLPSAGFELVDNTNHTKGAVVARDEDEARVNLIISGLLEKYPIFKVSYFGPRCYKVVERLIANFYRHPGTALYLNMVTGFDSYMHQAWRKKSTVVGTASQET